jgi:hypothetical protein
MDPRFDDYARKVGLGEKGREVVASVHDECLGLVRAKLPKFVFSDIFVDNFLGQDGDVRFGNVWFFARDLCTCASIFDRVKKRGLITLKDRVTQFDMEERDFQLELSSSARLYVEFSCGEHRADKLTAAGPNCVHLAMVALKYLPTNFQFAGNSRYAMKAEADQLRNVRKTFWGAVRSYYRIFALADGSRRPETLEGLVEIAGVPPYLPVPKPEQVRDYFPNHSDALTPEQSLLFAFCRMIYPASMADNNLDELTRTFDRAEFASFDEARAKLAKFWNRWRMHGNDVITVQEVMETYSGEATLLKLLCYLEVALAARTMDPGQGKQGLFELASDWSYEEARGERRKSSR